MESIDFARDLHTIGGLPTLLALMNREDAGLRWRAAEVVATCVANHESIQKVTRACGNILLSIMPILSRQYSSRTDAWDVLVA